MLEGRDIFLQAVLLRRWSELDPRGILLVKFLGDKTMAEDAKLRSVGFICL